MSLHQPERSRLLIRMTDIRQRILDQMLDPDAKSRALNFLRLKLLKPEQIVSHLPDAGVIYDLGCGFGLCTVAAALDSNTTVTGYDIDASRIINNKKLFRNMANITFDVANILDFHPPQPADAIMIIDSLHYFAPTEQVKIIQSVWMNIRPGGVFVIRDALRDGSLKFKWNQLHEKLMVEIVKWTKSDAAKSWFLDQYQWHDIFANLPDVASLSQFACHVHLPYNDHLFVLHRKR